MSSRLKTWIGLLVLAVLLLVSMSVTLGQDSRVLVPGTPVSGTLDAQNVAQVYAFSGTSGQTVTITVKTTSGLKLAVLLTDAGGAPIAQASASEANADVVLSAVKLQNGGTYYVTVLSADGVSASGSAAFQLTLDASGSAITTFTEPGQLPTTTGLQVSLTWNSTANMDLEVRDPIGGSLRFANPIVPSGGKFGVNVNGVCASASANSPTEQASWQAGAIPTGSYELLVYYQPLDACPTTDPVSFTINATLDGKAVPAFEGTLSPNQVYIASFIIKADGTVSTGLSGVRADPPTIPDTSSAAPVALTRNTAVSGVITSQQPFVAYQFAGNAGEVVSILMNATSGSLDTLLMLLAPNGTVAITNDDKANGITDSEIVNTPLVLTGTYTIIATRYGQAIGGTEGGFNLTLTGQVADSTIGQQAAAVPNLPNLPKGSVEVILQWDTAADVELLVRDPRGDTVFNDKTQIPSGGTLAANANVNCKASNGTPTSYIYWPEGRLPSAGAYEVEVQYRNNCNDTRPVNFTLYVLANGQLVMSKNGELRQDERFVTNYTIGVNGDVTGGDGGIFGTTKRPDVTPLNYATEIENAQVIASGQSVLGSIRLDHRFDVYVFDGKAGQVATIGLNAQNGTLDTVLFLLNPGGVQVAQNDDAVGANTTNSLISGYTLSEDGRYIIIATHFGGPFGVTAGDYNLTLRLN